MRAEPKRICRWPCSRHAHFPSAGFGGPVADSRLKGLNDVGRDGLLISVGEVAHFIHQPAIRHIAVGDDLKGNLSHLARKWPQVHDGARPHATAGGVVTRRSVHPDAVRLNLDDTVAVAAELVPVKELEPGQIGSDGHDKGRGANHPGTGVGWVVPVEDGGGAVRVLMSAQAGVVGGRPGERRAEFPDAVFNGPQVRRVGSFKRILPDDGLCQSRVRSPEQGRDDCQQEIRPPPDASKVV